MMMVRTVVNAKPIERGHIMTDPVTISQYPQGFLGAQASQPFVLVGLISAVMFVFLVGITWLINVMTHGDRRPTMALQLSKIAAVGVAMICAIGVLGGDIVKESNNFDTVSNAYGITISKPSDVMRVLQSGAQSGSTSITYFVGDGKPQMGILARKGNKVTVYAYNITANRLTPLKRAAH